MKKQVTTLLLFCLFTILPSQVKADEGMWTLFDLPQPVYQQMQAEGFSLPYESLYSADGAIMKAVVNFGGFCSGVVVFSMFSVVCDLLDCPAQLTAKSSENAAIMIDFAFIVYSLL